MATEFVCDPAGLNGFDWDSQGVGLYAAGSLLHLTGAAVRGGVIPAAGSPLRYTLKAGMVGTLAAGTYVLPAPDPANGVYVLQLPVAVDITHETANATQPRTDLIIAEVSDQSSGASTKKFRRLLGSAGVGAPDPLNSTSLGNGASVAIARVNVPANASTLGTITDLRTFTAGAGGMVPVANAAAAAALPVGTPVYLLDSDRPGAVTPSGVRYGNTGRVTQQVSSDGVSGGSIPNDGADHGVGVQTLSVAAGALVECEYSVWIVATGNAAGYLNLTLGDQVVRRRWHNQGNAGLSVWPIGIKCTAGAAGSVSATLSINVDTGSGGAVSIPNVPSTIREIL